ncbi:MAG: hypothetical protein JNN05_06055 [Candidatus Omnitrophica bacterium]|nr:hypothetical protein [Candidatus Omnitrophota bacterium]
MVEEKNKSKINADMLASIWNIIGGIFGCSLLGFLIGKKIDQVVISTLIGVFMGGLYSALEVWKIIRKLNQ